ncbi:MAG: methyltransferase domain-containing protein [Chrysiogenia bacterium]
MKNSIKKIKYLLRRNVRQGKFRRTWSIFHYVENMWKFHSAKRFKNWLRFKYQVLSKRMAVLKIGAGINNGVFYLGLRMTRSAPLRVVKIPRFDNQYSAALYKKVRSPEGWREYSEYLTQLHLDAVMGKHFPVVHEVHRDGGYESDFIDGVNLNEIRDAARRNLQLPEKITPKNIVAAIEELLQHLRQSATKHGRLNGDWAPHNMIYQPEKSTIFNVDLEGMLLYDPEHIEAKIEYIEAELKSIVTALELRASDTEESREILSVLAECVRVSESGHSYSGNAFFAGYHTLNLRDRVFNGQRRAAWRLSKIPLDFSGKNVLDIGCNSGGMLHALADNIALGIGIDRDPQAIKAANLVARVNAKANLKFHTFDIEHDAFERIVELFDEKKINICMMLSICMWINNCREVMRFAAGITEHVLIETNGSPLQQSQQEKWLREVFQNVNKLDPESLDDYQQNKRTMFLCNKIKQF